MLSFALVTEGLTDQIVISRLVRVAFKIRGCDVDLQINPLQPLRDATDSHHAPHAGWELVFDFCEHEIVDALATNDFVIVHLDTDQGDHKNFGLELTVGGVDRIFEELIDDAISIIKNKIPSDISQEALLRILFAIPVHATESWILLLMFGREKLKSPFESLPRELRKGGFQLKKEARVYSDIMMGIKSKAIQKHFSRDNSLGIFLMSISDLIDGLDGCVE